MARRGEFDLIAEYFAPLAEAMPGALGLVDDAAVFEPPEGCQIVTTVDAIVEGVHFRGNEPAGLIAKKLLRVNLSDLAAMGAKPFGYLLTLALPEAVDDAWLEGFASGLADDQTEFDIGLLGGDTVNTRGPIALTLTALGTVATGKALLRSGAQPGDQIVVSGSFGDAALGLALALGAEDDWVGALSRDDRNHLYARYCLPRPRLDLGQKLAGVANAALDVSDGLIADTGHMAKASGVAIDLHIDRIPVSRSANFAVEADPGLLTKVLTGGDDYELALSVSPVNLSAVMKTGQACGVPLSQIGTVRTGEGVRVLDPQGNPIPIARGGWEHA